MARFAQLLCVVLAVASASAWQTPAGTRVERDVVYARAGQRELKLDLYLPQGAPAPVPVVVAIHGGGWQSGSKENAPGLFLAERGYAVASIEYRLSGEAVFPAQIEDCKAAVRWLRANSTQYGLNPDRIAAIGSSAGGHLAALLGTTSGMAGLDPAEADDRTKVRAVVDLFGPSDLARMGGAHDLPDSPESRLLGGAVPANPDKAAYASPVIYASREDPPFLLVHGDQDGTVPLEQSRILNEALRAKGVECTLRVVVGAGHGFALTPDLEAEVAAFLDGQMKTQLRRDGWADPDRSEPSGTQYRTFYSQSAGGDVSYLLWLPPGYADSQARRYPVIYYLHGRGGTQRSGTGASDLLGRIDSAVRAGLMPPVIAVFANGLDDSYWIDNFSGSEPVERAVLELIAHIDRICRTWAAPAGRAIEGVSMGGFGAAHFAFKFPEWFAAVRTIAGAFHDGTTFATNAAPPVFTDVFGGSAEYANANAQWQLTQRNADAIRDRLRIHVVIGDQDSLLGRNWNLHNWMLGLGIPHEFTMVPGVAHSGSQLYAALGDRTASFYTSVFGSIGTTPAASAASFRGPALAPDSLASVFGLELATTTVAAASLPLPATLGGTAIRIRDSRGTEHAAKLLFVSPRQANFLVPAEVEAGPAEVRVTSGAGIVSVFAASIPAVAPGLFSADGTGAGRAAAYLTGDIVSLFGTGIRGRSSLGDVRVRIGGRDCDVLYAGAQPQFAGLDQVNARVPAGTTGDVEVILSAHGLESNALTLTLK